MFIGCAYFAWLRPMVLCLLICSSQPFVCAIFVQRIDGKKSALFTQLLCSKCLSFCMASGDKMLETACKNDLPPIGHDSIKSIEHEWRFGKCTAVCTQPGTCARMHGFSIVKLARGDQRCHPRHY